MACNVFGTPVTRESVKRLPEYAHKESITRKDLANLSMSLKNAEGKDIKARSYVKKMCKGYDKAIYCALLLIYNATGDRLRLHGCKYLNCIVGPAASPLFIENRQWGSFMAVTLNREQVVGCSSAVIYRGCYGNGSKVDIFMGWDTRVLPRKPNACVRLSVPGAYNSKKNKGLLKMLLRCSPYTKAKKNGLLSTATIGMHHMAVVEFIHTHT